MIEESVNILYEYSDIRIKNKNDDVWIEIKVFYL